MDNSNNARTYVKLAKSYASYHEQATIENAKEYFRTNAIEFSRLAILHAREFDTDTKNSILNAVKPIIENLRNINHKE